MARWVSGLLIVVVPLLVCIGCSTPRGWTDGEKNGWYVADQGSRLIPEKWIDALEQPSGAAPVGNGKFVDPGYLAQFKYLLPSAYARKDADPTCPIDMKLPIGFVTDCQDASKYGVTNLTWLSTKHPTEPWVGMNCAACHTNAIELPAAGSKPATTMLVDGAPTLADFQGFMAKLEQALLETSMDDQKFARFAAAVLPKDEAAADRQNLRTAVGKLVAWNEKLADLNADKDLPYGYGRLDAIGHIFNKVALAAVSGGPQTRNPADAPVSYPFLWNVPQLDFVEWNGIAPNIPVGFLGTEDFGALARNTGEVIGVFADITVVPNAGFGGFVSSARVKRLDQMEQQLRWLKPPAWPAQYSLDKASVDAGRTLFRDKCSGCHTVPDRFRLTPQRFTVALTPLSDVKTDMWMACNAVFDRAKAGGFAGQPQFLVKGDKLPDPAFNVSMAKSAAVGALLGRKEELVASAVEGVLGLDRGLPQAPQSHEGYSAADLLALRGNECAGAIQHAEAPHHNELVYKGRPLQGIWATAPYLHNGSVPSLYALLQAPKDRPDTFCVGSRVFDPKEVGFEYKGSCAGLSTFQVKDASNTIIHGNSNEGHEYGTALPADQKRALLEYMKTL
jgi:mono/diheme cytochrome c family protein